MKNHLVAFLGRRFSRSDEMMKQQMRMKSLFQFYFVSFWIMGFLWCCCAIVLHFFLKMANP